MSATDEIKNYYLSLGIKESVYDFCEATEQALLPRFQEIDRIAEQNQIKVISAMQKAGFSESHLMVRPDTATTIAEEKQSKRFTPMYFTPRTHWYVSRLPVVPMHYPLPCPRICVRAMKSCPRSEKCMIL